MTPYLGKGATCAIVDAQSLAKSLQDETDLENGQDILEKLSIYEKDMLAAGFKIAKQSMMAQRLIFDAGISPWISWIRTLTFKALDLWIPHPCSDTLTGMT